MQIDVFDHVAEAIRAIAEMFGTFTDNVAHFIDTGYKEWDEISAKQMHARLLRICARSAWTLSMPSSGLDDYLSRSERTPADWTAVTHELDSMLHEVNAVLDDLRKERSEFVLDGTYEKLLYVLRSESDKLARLVHLPPPETPEALASLRELNKEYKIFLGKYHEALQKLDEYVKSHR